jgi:hypothetical protein
MKGDRTDTALCLNWKENVPPGYKFSRFSSDRGTPTSPLLPADRADQNVSYLLGSRNDSEQTGCQKVIAGSKSYYWGPTRTLCTERFHFAREVLLPRINEIDRRHLGPIEIGAR